MKSVILFLLFSLFWNPFGLAADPAEYESALKELSQAIELFRELSKPGPTYEMAFRRDPMQPLVDAFGNPLVAIELEEGLTVQGIVWSEDFRTVVVDDKSYVVGDTVGAYKILEIRPDGFLAEKDSETEFISLYPERQTQGASRQT